MVEENDDCDIDRKRFEKLQDSLRIMKKCVTIPFVVMYIDSVLL